MQLRRYSQTCNSKLNRAQRRASGRDQERAAPFLHLHFPSLWCRVADAQEAAYADGDLRWRAEQGGLQLGYQGDSWTLHALRPLISWSLVVCAICSHVSVDIVVVVYERGEVAGRSRVESFSATRDLESNIRLYTR